MFFFYLSRGRQEVAGEREESSGARVWTVATSPLACVLRCCDFDFYSVCVYAVETALLFEKFSTERFAYDLRTPQRAKLFDPEFFCSNLPAYSPLSCCHGNATSPPFILRRNYAHPLHPPREHALSTPSSTLRWASPLITTQFPK